MKKFTFRRSSDYMLLKNLENALKIYNDFTGWSESTFCELKELESRAVNAFKILQNLNEVAELLESSRHKAILALKRAIRKLEQDEYKTSYYNWLIHQYLNYKRKENLDDP